MYFGHRGREGFEIPLPAFLLCVVLGFTYLQYRVDPCTAHMLGSLKSANPPERSIFP